MVFCILNQKNCEETRLIVSFIEGCPTECRIFMYSSCNGFGNTGLGFLKVVSQMMSDPSISTSANLFDLDLLFNRFFMSSQLFRSKTLRTFFYNSLVVYRIFCLCSIYIYRLTMPSEKAEI